MNITSMKLLVFITFIIAIAACESGGSSDYKRPAGGTADEIMVVVDSAVWAGPVGQELKGLLAAPMMGLPQDEDLFDMYQINPLKLNTVLKSAYNMIFITTLDRKSRQSKEMQGMFTDQSLKKINENENFFQIIEDDKFATNQKVLFLFGKTQEKLAENIAENKEQILALFEDRAMQINKKKVLKSREKKLEKVITKNHGYSIQVPYGWKMAKDHIDFVWFRELDLAYEKNVFIYQQPYSGPQDFNKIEALRDKICELHLRDSQKPELFIQRQEIVPVDMKQINFNGKFAIESRGLWAVSDLSGGGPFLSYTMVDEENGMLYYIEGYVYNPGGKKKRFMRDMDAILSTFRIPSEVNK